MVSGINTAVLVFGDIDTDIGNVLHGGGRGDTGLVNQTINYIFSRLREGS